MKRVLYCLILGLAIVPMTHAAQKKEKQQATPLDQFLESARKTNPSQPATASLFSATAPNLFIFRDIKAQAVNDVVTIQIIENAEASNSANTSAQKKSDISLAAAAFNFDEVLKASSALELCRTRFDDAVGSTPGPDDGACL